MERPAGPFSREMGLRWWRESDEVGGRRWVAQGADTAFSFPLSLRLLYWEPT